jgi:hypothetical protein
MKRYVTVIVVLVSLLTACRPLQASTPPPPTIQPPTCAAPRSLTDSLGTTMQMHWVAMKHGDHGDYQSENTVHYILSDDGAIIVWKGSNQKIQPDSYVTDLSGGRLFIVFLTEGGPIFFFVCTNGGAYIDDSRGVKITIGQEG